MAGTACPKLYGPWGRTIPSTVEGQRAGPRDWSRVRGKKRGRRGGQGEDGAGGAGPYGSWEDVGRGGVGPQSGDHRCNGCCKKSHAVGVERMQVTTLVHVGHEREDERDGHVVSSQ